MIQYKDRIFWLQTQNTSYVLCVTKFNHLEHVFYGPQILEGQNIEALRFKNSAITGSSVNYDSSDDIYCLDTMCLEWSGTGRGDYRHSPLEIKMPDGSFVHDFIYKKHKIFRGSTKSLTLPNAYGMPEECTTLIITLEDESNQIELELYYTVFYGTDVITRRGVLNNMSHNEGSIVHNMNQNEGSIVHNMNQNEGSIVHNMNHNEGSIVHNMNHNEGSIVHNMNQNGDAPVCSANQNQNKVLIRRISSMMLDLPARNFVMTTFDGGWIKETHRHTKEVTYGMYVNSSTTGSSSNRHNPGFLLSEKGADQEHGFVYGFNLIYSGNHCGVVELSNLDIARVEIGINAHCFEWELKCGESFETPEAVMTFSNKGFNGASHHMHDFINEHIVRGNWKKKERPVLVNDWEAYFFDFNENKLLQLAKQAKKLGAELFVLDDGWFGNRNSDKAGLGDYRVNTKKLPDGVKGFADKIRKMGLKVGLWFEPEMVNKDSDLYRRHKDYAVELPGKKATLGRNQLVLNLCKPEVQDYIVDSVSKILDEAGINYVKWDMNRHMSEIFSATLENQGEFFHRYIIGLYSVLNRIFGQRPDILLESCSSGGNRFDLGMLCFSPQIWSSDDTDPIERLQIQEGLSYLYPLSAMGAHVSGTPHQQTLRQTPLSTRFNVSAFGCLGYELDIRKLSKVQKDEIKEQIEYYKKHRLLFQYGIFSRVETFKCNKIQWQCMSADRRTMVTGFFQTMAGAAEGYDLLRTYGLEENLFYTIETKPQSLYIERFGDLLKHIMPMELNPDGFILRTANKVYCLKDCVEKQEVQGAVFESGILLNNQYMGTGYSNQIRMLGDFGSSLYLIQDNQNNKDNQIKQMNQINQEVKNEKMGNPANRR